MPLFLAAVLAILAQPLYRRFLVWTKDRRSLAAAITTALLLTIVVIPLALGTVSAARQLYRITNKKLNASDLRVVMQRLQESTWVQEALTKYGEATGEPVTFEDLEKGLDARLNEISKSLASKTLDFAGSTLTYVGGAISVLVSVLTFVIAFYYFLADGPALIEGGINLIPVHREYQKQLILQFDQAVRAVVSATFAAAFGQGLATAAGMWVAGYHHFFLVTILGTLTALVPLLGTWLVWGPYALWLGLHDGGSWMAAGLLTLYGTVFVGLLDNAIRTYVLHSNVKLHPLLAFVSVLGGLEVLGLWGVFIGPIVASCLHALVRIFNIELIAFSHERWSQKFDPGSESTVVMSASEMAHVAAPARGVVTDGRDSNRDPSGAPTPARIEQGSTGGPPSTAGNTPAPARTAPAEPTSSA
jgi:predicted PurR-regulated permease PerM